MKREAYRTVAVKQVLVDPLVADRGKMSAMVGIDVAKHELIVMVRWADGRFERPWKVGNPDEIRDLIHRLQWLAKGRVVTIAMESTGTYGDAFRQAASDAKFDVHRVSGKAVHDYAEIFDGVPSQHDGKDAAMVADLAALGKSSPWPYQPPAKLDEELRYWVERADAQQRIGMVWLGRLEALLARHWPEATRRLELNSATLLRALMHYGGPAAMAADKAAVKRLKQWGGRFLKDEKIERLVEDARASVGVRQTAVDRRRMTEAAQAAWTARQEVEAAEKNLKALARSQATIVRQADAVGWVTACVLWVYLDNPAKYHCAEAYRKAMGLNLKERSSGRYQGQLKITKRGPAAVRRWMYFAAMRMVQHPDVAEWYRVKRGDRPKEGKRALTAVMRKLALGLYALGVGEDPFDSRKLFSAKAGRRKQRKSKSQPVRRQKV
jgi:transposase